MEAWLLEGPGGPEAFRRVTRELPRLDEGWVLIRVESFGLNRSELHSRKGLAKGDFSFPRVLGLECAGRVEDGNGTDLAAGGRVVALMGGMGRAFDGSYATHVAVPRSQVFSAPEDIPSAVLGAVPETYNTAAGVCLDNLALTGNDTVLVRGGTSALGMACIAIAKDQGCTVVATTRSPDKGAILEERTLADCVVVEGADVGARIAGAVGPVNAVVECVGSSASIESSCAAMPQGGRMALVGQLTETWDTDATPRIPAGVRAQWTRSDRVSSPGDDERMALILDRVRSRRWRANIHQIFSFADLPDAHRLMSNSGAVGKLVVVAE